MGVFGTARHRGVARGLVELFLQLPDLGEEGVDDRLGFRRLAGNQLFGDLQRHALHVGEKLACGQTDSQKTLPRAVADYQSPSPSRGIVFRLYILRRAGPKTAAALLAVFEGVPMLSLRRPTAETIQALLAAQARLDPLDRHPNSGCLAYRLDGNLG